MRRQGLNIDQAREILQKHLWERPECYGGFNPEGDYLIYSKHRDSRLLERVNYDEILSELTKFEETIPGRPDDRVISGTYRRDTIGTWSYEWTAKHWAVGHIDYIMVSGDSPDEMLILAAEIVRAMDAYPVFDEDAYSEAELGEGDIAWKDADMDTRRQWCKDVGLHHNCARNEFIPPEVFDWIRDSDWVQS